MSTTIRPEVSERNPYHINKHRYYELKHFCLQYPYWKKAYASISTLPAIDTNRIGSNPIKSDPTYDVAERLLYFSSRIAMVEACAGKVGPGLDDYVLRGVAEGVSFDQLCARKPCLYTREQYYDAYRRFFWELHKARR